MKWGRGEQHATVHMILAMLTDLPKHARFVIKTSIEREEAEEDDEPQPEPDSASMAYWERRYWSNPQTELLAANVNVLERLYYVLPQWQEGKGPKYPVVIGPREWWTDAQKRDRDQKAGAEESEVSEYSVADALKAMGATF